MRTFHLPDLGEGLQEAEIVAWHVSEGARVVADQPLVSVETDKAVVEVPAPWSGKIAEQCAAPGDIVRIGEALAEFDIEGTQTDAGAIVGELPGANRASEQPARKPSSASDHLTSPRAVPAVRRLARERGVDLALLKGTGPDGAITTSDVKRVAGVASVAGWEPLRGVRRSMARNMARAHSEVAATTVTEEAVIESWPDGEDVTLRLVDAMTAACTEVPALNAWYDAENDRRRLHDRIDLGLAVNTDDGLFVPVLRDVGNRSRDDLRLGLDAMKRDVAGRTIPAEELRGQTITLSNFGMVGGRHAALIVMPPQVAILGAGRISARACVVDGSVRPCRVIPLSLTFDHRAATGAEAARFLAAAKRKLED